MDSTTSELTLFVESSEFIIKKGNTYTSIQKKDHDPQITQNTNYSEKSKGEKIQGIVGLLEGKSSNYLLVIEKATYVGFIHKSRVFKINTIKMVKFVGDGSLSTEEDNNYNKMIDDHLKRNSLYFSDSYDLTTPISKMFERKTESNTTYTPFGNLSPNFCWNYNIGKIYNCAALSSVLIPIINGSVGIAIVKYNNTANKSNEFCFALISRKDTRRSGMRFLVRGADNNGNVANFAETEQIIFAEDKEGLNIVSYLQVRGSIPVLWKQIPDLQLNPEVNYFIKYTKHFLILNSF